MIPLSEAWDRSVVGGKAYNLYRLTTLGFNVPEGWVIPPDEAYQPGVHVFTHGGLWAVRSSAVAEDGAEHSYAGQYQSFLYVPREQVPQRVKEVREEPLRAKAYREAKGLPSTPIAVIIQRMVDPLCAGTCFTRDPVTGGNVVAVEWVVGDGESLVSGRRTPYAEEFPHVELESSLILSVAQGVAQMGMMVEEALRDGPQDIEWALGKDLQLYVLQARPITRRSHG